MSRVVALVDWPDPGVPRGLLRAGWTVVSLNLAANRASGYAWYPTGAGIPAQDKDEVTVLTDGSDGNGCLVCWHLDSPPATVDVVGAYRPAAELPAIARTAVDLGATTFWLLPGCDSPEAVAIAEAGGLTVARGERLP